MNLPIHKIIIIAGPTGAGKTETGFRLALKIKGEIINADSRQFYKEINIGTAKPSKSLLDSVPHHLIDFISLKDDFTAFDFKEKAEKIILDTWERGNTPIIVGGSGLYIRILLKGIFLMPPELKEKQKTVRNQLEKKPTEQLYGELLKIDPEINIHPNDRVRIRRALEVWHITGKPMSTLWEKTETSPVVSEAKTFYFILDRERKSLYSMISERIDRMLQEGWIEEVKKLCEDGFKEELKTKAAIGYPEIIEYLESNCLFDDMVESIKKKTRNYARKQLTWFRKEKDAVWINVKAKTCEKTVEEIILFLQNQ